MDTDIKELIENIDKTLDEISKLTAVKLNSRVNNVGLYEKISRMILISALSWIFGVFLGVLGMASYLHVHSISDEQRYESVLKKIETLGCKENVNGK